MKKEVKALEENVMLKNFRDSYEACLELSNDMVENKSPKLIHPLFKEKVVNPNMPVAKVEVVTAYSVFNQMVKVLPETECVEDLYLRRNMLINVFENRVKFLLDGPCRALDYGFNNIDTDTVHKYGVSIINDNDILYNSKYNFLTDPLHYGVLLTKIGIADIATSLSIEVFNRMSNIINTKINQSAKRYEKTTDVGEYEKIMKAITTISMQFKFDISVALSILLEEAINIYREAGVAPVEGLEHICMGNNSIDLVQPLNKQAAFAPTYEDEF